MANNFTNANLNIFFDKLDGGATWSAGVAFKRAAALPLERYEVHKSLADAEAYASTNAVAYPGQVIAVIETEDSVEKVKIYFIDENKELQEVGSATLGDESSIVLDPVTKKLSIKGFENAGYASAIGDKYVADAQVKYYDLVDGKYIEKTTAPALDSEDQITESVYKRVGVKLIKDSDGNLNWITDDAVQIQADIAALITTVNNHDERIGKLEKDVKDGFEDVNDRIESLGTVFNFVGSLSVTDFSATTDGGEDNLIDSDATIPGGDRAYRAGDVVLVGNQEYVVVAVDGGLTWEAFGDPTGVSGIENRVSTLEETSTGHTNAINTLNGDVATEGSVKKTAKDAADAAIVNANDYTDAEVAKVKAIADANALEINGKAAEDGNPAVVGLKTKVATNTTSITNLSTTLNGKTPADPKNPTKEEIGVIARVTTLENTSATKTEVGKVTSDLTTLSENLTNNYETKSENDKLYAAKGLETTVTNQGITIGQNTAAINDINTTLGDGTEAKPGVLKNISDLQTLTGTHTSDISTLAGRVDSITAADTGSIALAQKAADAAQTSANNAQKDATQALADAAAASALAGKKATLDEVKALNYATKTEAEGYAKAVQGETTETVASVDAKASASATAASNAQDAADAAQGDATAALNKFSNYTTTTDMNAAIQAVVTNGSDTADSDTVKGAKKYTDKEVNAVKTTINNLKSEIGNLTNVMNFIGTSSTDPKGNDGPTVNDKDGVKIESFNAGDVIIYNAFEYVYTGSAWEIFGNVTADESRFEGIEDSIENLQGELETAQGNIETLQGTVSEHSTSITNVTGRVETLESDLNTETTGIKARLAATETVANAAATQTALQSEIGRATGRENAIEKYAQDGFAAQSTTNTTLQSNIDAIYKLNDDGTDSGLLAWGSF